MGCQTRLVEQCSPDFCSRWGFFTGWKDFLRKYPAFLLPCPPSNTSGNQFLSWTVLLQLLKEIQENVNPSLRWLWKIFSGNLSVDKVEGCSPKISEIGFEPTQSTQADNNCGVHQVRPRANLFFFQIAAFPAFPHPINKSIPFPIGKYQKRWNLPI